MSNDKYIEKSFLYLFLVSLVLHLVVVIIVFSSGGRIKKGHPNEPLYVDMVDVPDVKPPQGPDSGKARHQAEKKQRVAKETAPKGENPQERLVRPVPPRPPAPVAPFPPMPPGEVAGPSRPQEPQQQSKPGDFTVKQPSQPADSILTKPGRKDVPDVAKLFPNASKLARIEENYRKKYGAEVADGGTRFLNTDDILFGSFLRRFETAVYGVWQYPAEAVKLGLEGVTPVKITFDRKGRVVGIEILSSSGSKMLDQEVIRALQQIGPMGALPKGYGEETFNLIAFFQYGIIRGSSRGIIH